jgi:hypothetical protein
MLFSVTFSYQLSEARECQNLHRNTAADKILNLNRIINLSTLTLGEPISKAYIYGTVDMNSKESDANV